MPRAPGGHRSGPKAFGSGASEPLAHFNLGAMLLQRGQLQPAIEEFGRTVELQPTLVRAYDHLLRAYVAGGNGEAALSVARRWKRWAPRDPRVGQLIAEIERAMRGP